MKKRIFFVALLVTLGVVLGMIGYAGSRVYLFLTVPPSQQAVEKIVLLERGRSLRQIADQLKQQTVITDANLFMLLARFYRQGKSMKAGEYKFTTAMRPTEVLDMLQDGKIFFRAATIPEGYTALQIAELLEMLGFAKKAKFLQLVADKPLLAALKVDADNLEGYLFPSTYYIHHGMTEEELIREMVQKFGRVLTPELQTEIRQKGFTVHEIVTLASIIEKEAYAPEERALISAVYHNRLKIKMKLDSDPTVIYGIPNFNGNLTKADLQTDSPYNTYMHSGLPPGPIANPGEAALLAAIRPAGVKYLYFVAKNDGTHQFSENYQDHLRAVWKYQKNKQNNQN